MDASFPEGFVWGAATSSYQIEGASGAGARGDSVWDELCRRPGKIRTGDTGKVACDHVARYGDDVELMRRIGLSAYRFSISWPRVMPEGTGAVNESGLAFYDRLVDRLLAVGIEPYATLFHWDYPLSLHRRGGWLNPSSPAWFNEYARAVVDRLSDRVSNWMTLNEPQVFVELGYGQGEHAPGLKLPISDRVIIAHHVLKAHGEATRTIRERARTAPRIGWAPVGMVSIPASETPEDQEAARARTYGVARDNLWSNTWFADPVVLSRYPEEGLEHFGTMLPSGWERDLELISQRIDFYGSNTYRGDVVRAGGDGLACVVPPQVGTPRSDFGWEITPTCLYWAPKLLHDRYGVPILITENGMSNADWVAVDGGVHDPQRTDFLTRHLRELHRAIDDGVPVIGYFHWSLMDNFEWAEGYHQRFGLVHVDFKTQERTLKDSAGFYGEVIRTNGASVLTPSRSMFQRGVHA
ncbi:MAG: GH1 family beta-glucosidase [Planctomycetota bacterium]